MKGYERKLLITGGAGFIGSHVMRRFVQRYPSYLVYNLDSLTYAGNLDNVADVAIAPNYRFVRADVADTDFIARLFTREGFDGVIHLAAASHVDRSLEDPFEFVRTNAMGTASLLQAATTAWGAQAADKRFYYISTDEVYGTLGAEGAFTERSPICPQSPYSASKAAGDHLAQAFHNSYGLPTLISRCSNNYGPYQFPEKLIPLAISRMLAREPIPIYGRGDNVRDWLYVDDHAAAIDLIFHHGKAGAIYNIGGEAGYRNIDLVHQLCAVVDAMLGHPPGTSERLIAFVADRPGHDFRYAIDASLLTTELGWRPKMRLEEGLRCTVAWYLSHSEWLERIRSGAYRSALGLDPFKF